MTAPSNPLFSSLQLLAQMLAVARARKEERARTTTERFNVFTTLLEAHDEVRLHTRFLHNLLNPAGTHDCGALFLNLFFQTLSEFPPQDVEGNPVAWNPLPPEATWAVGKEVSTAEGQMDLLLECVGCGIAVENKIWAGEQPDQLKRYASYLQRRHGAGGRLLYLTLDGKAAGSHGVASYLRISYQEHILAWLEKCLQASYRFIPINQVLLQYREVVRGLTGQTADQAFMNQLTDFILQQPELLRQRQVINQAFDQARGAFLDRLVKLVQDTPPPGYSTRGNPLKPQTSFGQQNTGVLVIVPPPSKTQMPLHGAEWCLLHIPKWQALVVGIGWLQARPMEEDILAYFKHLNQRFDARCSETGYHKADPHDLWDGTKWPTGWHNIYHPMSDAFLASLMERPLNEVAAEVWKGIMDHVTVVESLARQTGEGV